MLWLSLGLYLSRVWILGREIVDAHIRSSWNKNGVGNYWSSITLVPQHLYLSPCDNILPFDLPHNQHQSFIQHSSHYSILRDTIYHMGYDGSLLRCLNDMDTKLPFNEVHSDTLWGSHQWKVPCEEASSNRLLLANMEHDACEFVKKYIPFQQHIDLMHAPSQVLQLITSPWPFHNGV